MSYRRDNYFRGQGERSRQFRGGRGFGARGRGGQQSWQEQPPQHQLQQQREFPAASGGNPEPEVKKEANAQKFKKEIKKKEMPNLGPKNVSTTASIEKNDPLINEAILIDGIAGFTERTRTRNFQLDFSEFITLVRSSYDSQITFDRSLRKYISFGMYQYYCIVLLWRRLLYVVSQRGEHQLAYDELIKRLNFSIPEPSDVTLYLNGVGDIVDFSDRHFQYALQTYPTDLEVNNIRGTFGQIGANTSIFYETVPSLFVAASKLRADFEYTTVQDVVDRNWDLPPGVRPANAHATLPNANLLGWASREKLTSEQLLAYEDANIDMNNYGMVNVHNLPINQNLMKYVAGQLENSKCKALGTPSQTTTGSLAQVPYSIRISTDVQPDPMKRAVEKSAATVCYNQASSHIASGSACFRYRFRRLDPGVLDSVCYRFDVPVPPAWLANENNIFNAGAVALWNLDQYRLAEQDGLGLATMVANRVRRKVTKD